MSVSTDWILSLGVWLASSVRSEDIHQTYCRDHSNGQEELQMPGMGRRTAGSIPEGSEPEDEHLC